MLFGRQFLLRLLPLSGPSFAAALSQPTKTQLFVSSYWPAAVRFSASWRHAVCTAHVPRGAPRGPRSSAVVRAEALRFELAVSLVRGWMCSVTVLAWDHCKSQRSLNSTEMWNQWCRMCTHSSEINSDCEECFISLYSSVAFTWNEPTLLRFGVSLNEAVN